MNANLSEVAVVLAAHGAPPTDYPPMRVGLQMMLEFAGKRVEAVGFLRSWRERLAHAVKTWPRTADTDPYQAAVENIAAALAEQLGCRVIASYNEFCTPTVSEAIDEAVAGGARVVVVIPTMLMRGNSHTEAEIQAVVSAAAHRHPGVSLRYAWPFAPERLVALFADQARGQVENLRP